MPTPPDPAAHLVEQSRLFGELLAVADPATPVPTCPGWTLRELGAHVGRGHRWAATIVAERAGSAVDPQTVEGGRAPDQPDAVARWLAEGVALLCAAVAEAPDAQVWTFVGPRPARWWLRRRLHETVAHRADAVLAAGATVDLPPEVAADAVSEWLSLVAHRPVAPEAGPVLDGGATLHLHATDGGLGEAGEWTVRREGARVVWEHGHAKGTVAVRGTAVDLLLALLRRRPVDDGSLQVFGDEAVFRTWLARTPF